MISLKYMQSYLDLDKNSIYTYTDWIWIVLYGIVADWIWIVLDWMT